MHKILNLKNADGLTGLELIIAIAVICIFIYLFAGIIFNASMPDMNHKSPGGIVGFAVSETGYLLIVDGDCYGMQDTGGTAGTITLVSENPSSSAMGSCQIPVKLVTGSTGAIEMDGAEIVFTYKNKSEKLSYSGNNPLFKPAWTISDKSGVIPFQDADEDLLLEPNEIFTILVYQSTPVEAYDSFQVSLTPKSSLPLDIGFKVPPQIRQNRIVTLLPV
ncbi:hypothetical protein F1737_10690 [Methanoplanus sp. FWC-SCC4]|uniref:Flagellin n=1 Tax=Methanochimaera problematica TaxID=2609417 RepID=A0AA97FDT1_9EURY|nr:hypothetical protein [Methanoplanus sp. FWC-SCC4]WOF17109.1 hypothetical protein F1737_10690 [Methanoplanus sp. FWC-SCC4]